MNEYDNKKVPENYHFLYDQEARSIRGLPMALRSSAAMTSAHRRLQAEAPDVTINYDEGANLPTQVFRMAPNNRLSQAKIAPDQAALAFLAEHRDLWRLTDEDVKSIEVVGVSSKGLPTVRLVQKRDGIEVFGSDMIIGTDSQGCIISIAGLITEKNGERIEAVQAVFSALADLTGNHYVAKELFETEGNDPGSTYFELKLNDDDKRQRIERPVRTMLVIFPIGFDRYVEAFLVEVWIKDGPVFSYVIEASESDNILYRKNLRSRMAVFKYSVHNTLDGVFRPHDGPAPGSPHPTGLPDGFQAPVIPEVIVSLESLFPGDPWLPDDATQTIGNNCIAYADLRSPDGLGIGDIAGQISGPREFIYTYDHSKDARDQGNLQSSNVGMFFHVNWLHDRWYEAGFDEAAGCAQQDNYGRGGIGGDPILAEGNDFSGTDNANMATPREGSSPRMQMFEFTGTNPTRTSNFEALITFHEMGHYITNRLVGNANGLTNQQGTAMGEGWGDFFAILMTSQPDDQFEKGIFPIGGWTDLTEGQFDENYYYSIRRFPYSTDFDVNPLTFKHIASNVTLPTTAPQNPVTGGGSNYESHNAGEVWCCFLWEVFVNLVQKHGHSEAEDRMLKLVIGGLKLTPIRPTFTQARDGIIATANVLFPSDVPDIWHGFAKRGCGMGAVSPSSNSVELTGVIESFTNPI